MTVPSERDHRILPDDAVRHAHHAQVLNFVQFHSLKVHALTLNLAVLTSLRSTGAKR
jgi:hypothetical protein